MAKNIRLNAKGGVSVIIPCYNDHTLIKTVLTEVQKSPYVREIIVVDDGSDEEVAKYIRQSERVKIFRHEHNKGKVQAVRTGIVNAKYPNVLLVDADLQGLSVNHINDLVVEFYSSEKDMVVGERESENVFGKYSGAGVAYTGERILKKELLEKILSKKLVKNYLIEPEISKYLLFPEKTGVVLMKGVGQKNKVQKIGLKGLWNDIKMFYKYWRYLGSREFFRQFSIGRKMSRL